MKEGFHIIEHPADIGIEACGNSLKDVFEFTALGLISVIVEPTTVDPIEQRFVRLVASDAENLLVKWLSEVLYLYDGQNFLMADVSIEHISTNELEAVITGEPVNERKHEFKLDVKAITYHQLKVVQEKENWLVRVFLDI
ncbi:MAG: archease [Ignavibacteriales bacterium]|nr:archease [Ignavibacteriales bacterium]